MALGGGGGGGGFSGGGTFVSATNSGLEEAETAPDFLHGDVGRTTHMALGGGGGGGGKGIGRRGGRGGGRGAVGALELEAEAPPSGAEAEAAPSVGALELEAEAAPLRAIRLCARASSFTSRSPTCSMWLSSSALFLHDILKATSNSCRRIRLFFASDCASSKFGGRPRRAMWKSAKLALWI